MQKNIIDVSVFQGDIDYDKVAQQVDGVIIRCGITFWGSFVPSTDSKWEKNYAGFKAAGVPVGAYYYGVARTVEQAEQEAAKCLELLKGKQLEYPIYYDVEEVNTQGSLSKTELTNVVIAFCTKLEQAGYYTGVYASLDWLLNKLDYATLSKRFTLWIAKWSSIEPTLTHDMWQYSNKGSINGISGDVDLNICYKDFEPIIKQNYLNGFTPVSPEKVEITLTQALALIEETLKNKGISAIIID